MDPFRPYVIPIMGLSPGVHHYEWRIEPEFFALFEGSPVDQGHFQVSLELDRSAVMLVLDFFFEGTVDTDCDRCLAPIALPIEGEDQVVIKLEDKESEEENEDPDVIFLPRNTSEIQVAQYIYEAIVLAMPYMKVYDCEEDEPRPCNMDALSRILPPTDVEPPAGGDLWRDIQTRLNDLS